MVIPHPVTIASLDAYKDQINTLKLPAIPQCTAAHCGCLHQEREDMHHCLILLYVIQGWKNKNKLVRRNYLPSTKRRRFGLREKGIRDRSGRQCLYAWAYASMYRCAHAAKRSSTNVPSKLIGRLRDAEKNDCTRAQASAHAWKRSLGARAHVARARRPHSQTLAARQNSVILCLEDRRRSSDLWPLLGLWGAFFPLWRWWLISVIYIAAPGGSSTGFTHLSFPLHCFSNGDEIECIAPWVCLPATLLCIEGTARKCICW